MKKIELLSPAGNMECLKAAINAGCDAVYLGGKLYGARSFAGNFNDEELIKAIEYSHLYGVRVYLTINTIIYEREVDNFLNYIRFAHKNNIDAVIIQDLGMLDLIRKKFPNLEIHLSTQMHIQNFEGALFAKRMGVKRIVMARETELSVIKRIKDELDIEVEIFGHGALCVSYSGQCLMSALIGNRSGNRGTCAQCCRKPYDLYDENDKKINSDKYLLSTKDLCTLEYLDEIINAKIDSLKIEGRMKRPEYVYIVTSIYRKVIDNYYKEGKINVSKEDILSLKKIFNRDFTKGFILKEENNKIVNQVRPNHQGVEIGNVTGYKNGYIMIKLKGEVKAGDGIRIFSKNDVGLVINKMFIGSSLVRIAHKNDVILIKFDKKMLVGAKVLLTTDSNQIKMVADLLKENTRKVLIDVFVEAKKGKNLFIKVTDGVNTVSLKSDFVIDKAINKNISKDTIIKQISKTGNTIYKIRNIDVLIEDDLFINIKDINELRRKVLIKLNEKRLYKIPFIEKEYFINVPDFKKVKEKSILINKKINLQENIYNYIYTSDKSMINNDKYILKIPPVVNKYDEYNGKVLISEVGSLIKYKSFDTDFSFNVVNSYTVAFLHFLGANKITLSHELTINQIKTLIDGYHNRFKKHPNLEVINEGKQEAMICKFDLNKMYNKSASYLMDEYNNKFKIESLSDYMIIYNYKNIKKEKDEKYYEIGINSIRTNLL